MCLICFDGQPAVHFAAPPEGGAALLASAELAEKGREFLARHATVDIHSHPGRFFMQGAMDTVLARESGTIPPEHSFEDMQAGGVGGAVWALVSDHRLLEVTDIGLRAIRPFEPGEAFQDFQRQLGIVAEVEKLRSGLSGDAPSVFWSVEGGDFIEDRLDRIWSAAAAGITSVTLIHYRANQIGDTQTEPSCHGGLTQTGREIVAEMEHAGVIVDLSHATFETARAVAAVARRPFILSHSNVRREGQGHPRLVSPEHARLASDSGGLVGAVPAGFDQQSFDDYIDTIDYMVDLLGIDHVAIGTDMDYTFRSVMPDYRLWPLLAGKLLARGFSETEAAKIMGGNWIRLTGGQATVQ